jgi:hypothetical protein
MSTSAIEEAVVSELRDLPVEKQLKVLDFVKSLGGQPKPPLKNVRGVLKDSGFSISAEDFRGERKEMWGSCSRERCFN